MNQNDTLHNALLNFRTRHLRKAEAAQLKKEALQTATKKKEVTVDSKTEAVSKEESISEDNSEKVTSTGTSTDSKTDVPVAMKKKQYKVNILSEIDTNVELTPPNVVPVDPQEFAKQERLRKQREKQVVSSLSCQLPVSVTLFLGKVPTGN